jgi:hypothetical protein
MVVAPLIQFGYLIRELGHTADYGESPGHVRLMITGKTVRKDVMLNTTSRDRI